MNCTIVEKRSIAYLDGSIDPRLRRQIEAHLAACNSCRERARQLQEVWGLLDEMPAVVPSVGFDAAVRARIAREPRRRFLWGWLVAPSPRLAISVTALLVCSVWLTSLPPVAEAPASMAAAAGATSDAEFRMIADLPVLEDFDVLSNFEALSELPLESAVTPSTQPAANGQPAAAPGTSGM